MKIELPERRENRIRTTFPTRPSREPATTIRMLRSPAGEPIANGS